MNLESLSFLIIIFSMIINQLSAKTDLKNSYFEVFVFIFFFFWCVRPRGLFFLCVFMDDTDTVEGKTQTRTGKHRGR